jgi:acyl-CoA thioesterase-2
MSTATGRRMVPYLARALVGDVLVAESRGAVRTDPDDADPALWFPSDDVVPGALGAADGAWRRGDGDLAECLAFDHERVRVELVDAAAGDQPRDITTKRFPTWGDAADLIEIIDVQPDGDGRYRSAVPCFDRHRPIVEGSQILGQSIVAASRHAPRRRVVSASMVFPRPADARRPYEIELDEVTTGRTFTALRAEARQGGRTRAFGALLLDVTAPDLIRHADPAPPAPGPYESMPFDMSVTGRDLRIVDDAYTGDPDAPVGPPVLDAWVRFRDVPDDPPVHAGLCAQLTGHLSIAAALRPHAGIGQDQAHRTISTAINAIALSIHADIRADRWLRYHHRSTFAGDGMTHAECRVYDEGGGLLASFTVDAMVRAFADPHRAVDDRTAM